MKKLANRVMRGVILSTEELWKYAEHRLCPNWKALMVSAEKYVL
jgi:hypothetical protein